MRQHTSIDVANNGSRNTQTFNLLPEFLIKVIISGPLEKFLGSSVDFLSVEYNLNKDLKRAFLCEESSLSRT